MVSVASGGRADRIAARIVFKVLRAGSGTPARYSSILFGVSPAFAADLRVAGLACFHANNATSTSTSNPLRRRSESYFAANKFDLDDVTDDRSQSVVARKRSRLFLSHICTWITSGEHLTLNRRAISRRPDVRNFVK
jgi:hypothetical protein